MNLNEHERTFDVHPVGVKYICENCNEGEMELDKENPIYFATNPPLIPHKCTKCGCKMSLRKTYPYIEWLSDDEYQEYISEKRATEQIKRQVRLSEYVTNKIVEGVKKNDSTEVHLDN